MTKILALNGNVKEGGDEKPKQLEGITISPTTPQATFYPVTLPISSIVAKKKCRTSHILIVLLSLITLAILFHMVHMSPDLFYKKVHHLISSEATVSGSALPWSRRSDRFDVSEDVQVMPKFNPLDGSEKKSKADSNEEMIQENRDDRLQDVKLAVNDEEETKESDEMAPNRLDAMKAIATLLKIPGVQQVAIVQNNGKLSDSPAMRPDILTDERANNVDEISPSILSQSLIQSQVPFVPQMAMKDWELMNYRRAIREWLWRRRMLRRKMLAQLERERLAAERRMSRFMMRLHLNGKQESEQPQQPQLPPYAFSQMYMTPPGLWMNNIQSPMDTVIMNQQNVPMMSMIMPRMPPMYSSLFPKQQQQLGVIPIPLMPPQMLNKEEPIIQPDESSPENKNAVPIQIADDTPIARPDIEQKKVPVIDQQMPMTLLGTPDRDSIFKELRSRAQVQQQMSQTALPTVMMPSVVPKVIPPSQVNSDEIFRELQHRALRMQIEQDRLDAAQRGEKEKNVNSDTPVLMIADTFPRRPVDTASEQVPEEVAGATISANTESKSIDENLGNSSESFPTFFNFLDKQIQENKKSNSVNKEQEITAKNDDNKAATEHSSEEETSGMLPAENDGVETIVKVDETAPQVNFVQELTTTEASANMDVSEETQSELFKPVVFQDEKNSNNNNPMLDTAITMLETPQIQ
uniref:Uncharacterized protein n=1 Tax=Setaria digitata TaxID=48799 RepID=A0A915PX59_9BILA